MVSKAGSFGAPPCYRGIPTGAADVAAARKEEAEEASYTYGVVVSDHIQNAEKARISHQHACKAEAKVKELNRKHILLEEAYIRQLKRLQGNRS